MNYRSLGRSGLQVSPICFGGNVFGWTADEKTSFSLLDAWLDEGFNFVDTADVYSYWVKGHTGGESETIIGKWFKASGKRDKVVLATKVGKPMPAGKGLSPAYIRRAVEDSLRRLQTDVIDLYQSHDDDTETPQEETMAAFTELVRAGKVRAVGCSNYSADRLRSALQVSEKLGLARYESLQPLYNLYSRKEFEDGLQQVCTEYGVGVIPFYALAAGFLTGKYRTPEDASKSARGGNIVKNYLNERGLRILDALDAVAKRNNATCGQVAVAWQLTKPAITAPIASATSLQQLKELAAAARLKLSAEDVALLDEASR
ncbi:aldo/keto reductase [Ramlibacter albus]|uniref:Aldo/keto reductase n=1 Tax=Ramlibacter albus TaxID=2079448 RepID=A0A923MEZ8_9BURK|nr:aldo/keto reductase [Ramlibacter albus]MBC5768059.1 aldo/keto reductase [Ramlibacter albus]